MNIKQVISTPVSDEKMLKKYYKKIFQYDSSEADERFFRTGICDFFKGLDYSPDMSAPYSWYDSNNKSFKDHIIELIWIRNNEGITSKYMYFNDHNQRLYLDNIMWEWCVLAAKMIYSELKKVNQNAN